MSNKMSLPNGSCRDLTVDEQKSFAEKLEALGAEFKCCPICFTRVVGKAVGAILRSHKYEPNAVYAMLAMEEFSHDGPAPMMGIDLPESPEVH